MTRPAETPKTTQQTTPNTTANTMPDPTPDTTPGAPAAPADALTTAGRTEKRVSWAELFFDLVFVLAVTQISHLLHEDHDWLGVLRALAVFVPIYWGWVGTAVFANTVGADRPLQRIGVFGAGLAGLFMSLAVPHAYGDQALLYAGSYFVMRFILAAYITAERGLTVSAFSVSLVVTSPMILAGALLDGWWRLGLWIAASVVNLATPAFTRDRNRNLVFDPAHLTERYGLFLIIALGESIVAVGSTVSESDLHASTLTAVGAGFVLACGIWWVYFAFAASAVRHALETTAEISNLIRQVLTYGHLVFVAGIISTAVGLAEAVAHPDEALHRDVIGLLFGGTALFLAGFGYTRWRMFRKVSKTRLAAAALTLLLGWAVADVPAVWAVSALALLVVSLNLVEAYILHRWSTL